jgi:hypothetical protein
MHSRKTRTLSRISLQKGVLRVLSRKYKDPHKARTVPKGNKVLLNV